MPHTETLLSKGGCGTFHVSSDLGVHCEHEGERQALASLPMLTRQTWKSSFLTLFRLGVKPMLTAFHGSAE